VPFGSGNFRLQAFLHKAPVVESGERIENRHFIKIFGAHLVRGDFFEPRRQLPSQVRDQPLLVERAGRDLPSPHFSSAAFSSRTLKSGRAKSLSLLGFGLRSRSTSR
jgi:hypothetical protein